MAEYNYIKKYEKYLGQTFGKLTILEVYKGKWGARAKCQCECGNEHHTDFKHLKNGETKSCGCLFDLTNKRFGKLLAVEKTDERSGPSIVYKCQCDCGNTAFVAAINLSKGLTRSCGCLSKSNGERHGMSYTPAFSSWASMIQRCYNGKQPEFQNYGGRGIMVCNEWRHSFVTFHKDMGDRPEGKTLDRIDVNGDYEPANCRWATPAEQARNTRRTRYFTLNNKTQCIADWALELGISHNGLLKRLKKMPIEQALSCPVNKQYSSRYRNEYPIHTG